MPNITPTQKSKHLNALTILMFINMIGFSILIPVIPSLFLNVGGEYYILPSYIDHKFTFILQGFLLTIYSLCSFLSSPLLGELSDYYGRKVLLKICFAGSAVGYILFGYAVLTHNIWLLFLSRIIDGVTGGNITILQASTVDVTTPQDRAKVMAERMSIISLAFVVGPLIGGVLSSREVFYLFNPAVPFIFAGLVSFLAIYLIKKNMLETRLKVNDTSHMTDEEYHAHHKFSFKKLHPFNSIKSIISGYRIESIRVFLNLTLLFFFGFGLYTAFAQNLLAIRFSFGEREMGYYFAFVGVIMYISQKYIVPRLNAKFKGENLLLISISSLAILFLIYVGLVYNIFALTLFSILFVLLISISMVNMNVAVANAAPEKERGKVFGITSSLQSLANVFAPILGGVMASYVSYTSPFYLAAVFLGVAVGMLYAAGKNN